MSFSFKIQLNVVFIYYVSTGNNCLSNNFLKNNKNKYDLYLNLIY